MSGSAPDWTVRDWVTLVMVLTAPGALLVALGMLRGYSIKVWRDGRRKGRDQ